MFSNRRPASEYHNILNISKKLSRDKSRAFITIEVENDGLAEKILENIKRNCNLSTCKNCTRRMIVNSATHQICWRCRLNDKLNSGPEEI